MKFEDMLSDALKTAVGVYNDTGDPDRAVVKAAEKHGFNRDQTERLVEKFNTAKTISFYEAHPDDRTADFPLASKEKVADIMYFGPEEKKASAPVARDYSFYDMDLDSWRSEEGRSELEKEASAEESSDSGGYSMETLQNLSGVYMEKYSSAIDSAEASAGMLDEVAYDETQKLAERLAEDRSGYKYAMFMKMAGKMRGVEGLGVQDMVPGYVKEAAAGLETGLSSMNAVDSSAVSYELEMAAGIVGMMDESAKLRKFAEKVSGRRSWLEGELVKISQSSDDGKDQKKKKKGDNTAADLAAYLTHSALPASPKGVTDFLADAGLGSELDIQKALYGGGKSHEVADHIDNVRRSDILTDLYANDPILSEHDPEEVSDAYRTLVETSPEMSLNKEVSRSVLRQMVAAQSVSPFDAKSWLEYDKLRLGNKGYPAVSARV